MVSMNWDSVFSRCRKLGEDLSPPDINELDELLSEAEFGSLGLDKANRLFNALYSDDFGELCRRTLDVSKRARMRVFGNRVAVMAPVEVSNICASDCQFCGWRRSNPDLVRLKIDSDLVLAQVDYLLDHGIDYIELVGGDDFRFVRDELPELVPEIRRRMHSRGMDHGQICICSMALTEPQYAAWREMGVDSMFVWQESYDPQTYSRHILGGPKAHGVGDDWRVLNQNEGYRFRLESQQRALNAGLDVGLGFMMGLHSNMNTEFLSLMEHARYLLERGASPLIVGMPTWNNITTPCTDLRPEGTLDIEEVFPFVSAVIFLALPKGNLWTFPNCRVSMETQVLAVETSGCFSSTEVKLGPGGYLPELLHYRRHRGISTSELERRISEVLGMESKNIFDFAALLDNGEQFLHHYHSHSEYKELMAERGLVIAGFNEMKMRSPALY